MKVFKFGGASVKDAAGIRNVCDIIKMFTHEKLLVVISAMGKTTNALEEVVAAFHEKKDDQAKEKIKKIEESHFTAAEQLFNNKKHPVFKELHDLFRELYDIPLFTRTDVYNFLYDQVVCFGELFSTKLATHYFADNGINAHWLDARNVIKTDKTFREGKIIWDVTANLIKETAEPLLEDKIVITPGFIGSTLSNHTTTLGREGSDFTAAIFASVLNADELVIWKDVPGVLNCDPKQFPDALLLEQINYHEAVEMTYYGAQVIHPKTIKPIQNKNIPLRVRSFIEKEKKGTLINNSPLPSDMPPVIVFKRNQVLLELSTKDFSFMAEDVLVNVYEIFARHAFRINMAQHAAISLSAVVDAANRQKLDELLTALQTTYNLTSNYNVELLTIRHYNKSIIDHLTKGRKIIIEERNPETVQFLMEMTG
jgi:aspartate kinase